MTLRAVIGAACAVSLAIAMPAAARGVGEVVTPQFEQAIPNIPGKSLIAVVVDYAPGGASPSHAHAKSAFIFGYVVSGAIETQVNDEPKRIVRAGEELLRAAGRPSRSQPQCKRDGTGKAACRVRRRYERPRTDLRRILIPTHQEYFV